MENRVSRTSSSRSATASEIDDALYPAYHYYRPGPSLAVSTSHRRPVPPSRDNSQPSPENVFADPADSPPPSPTGSAFYSNSIVTPSPSVRRPSLSLSARRSPSPLPGGNGGYYAHRLSQSLTPSIRSSSSSTYGHGNGNGLNRSNTTGTNGTGYSTLSSIPSNLSDFTSPPSPLPPIAPVRPQWNYGGHQQNIYPDSVHTGSVVPEEDDPFADGFTIPVGDGFAPHHQRPPVAMAFPSGPSSVGSVEPPPYTRYPKPEEVGTPLMRNGDSGVDIGRSLEEDTRNRRSVLAAAGGVALLGGSGGGGGGGDDGSGARKEWKERRVFGLRLKAAVAIALILLATIALGVGLGIGLRSSAAAVSAYPSTITTNLPPNSEETGPPLSSPNATYPAIPTGLALISPLVLSNYASTCGVLAQDASAPDFFHQGANLLWSCQYDQSQDVDALTWRFEQFLTDQQVNMADFVSLPPFLRSAEYGDGKWGAYLVSSIEGIRKWEDKIPLVTVGADGTIVEFPDKPVWRDGAQNQPFWRIPLGFYNRTGPTDNTNSVAARSTGKQSSNYNYSSYKFGALVNKTVIIKHSTIEANIAAGANNIRTGNGTALLPGEIIWKCTWEKTLLEVELFVSDPSEGFMHENEQHNVSDSDKPQGNRPSPTTCSSNSNSSSSSRMLPSGTGVLSDLRTQPTPGGNLSATYKHRRHAPNHSNPAVGGPVGSYPLRIAIQESRPTNKRIRQLLGIDLTDPDPYGQADLGAVRCMQFTVTAGGGLTPFLDRASGEGYVVLKEQGSVPVMKERSAYADRDGEGLLQTRADSGCFCRWSS